MKNKIVTFSFDDGIQYDEKLVKLLNKYNLKCTFNINTGLILRSHMYRDIEVHRLLPEDMRKIYVGHEIASHSLTHPSLDTLTAREIEREVYQDIENIKSIFKIKFVPCFAFPNGSYSDEVKDVLKKLDIKFARTIKETCGFSSTGDLLEYKPTAHYRNEKIFDIIDGFLKSNPKEKSILYIWGHAYEPEGRNEWNLLEEIFKRVANRDDIDYLTNGEAFLNDASAVYKG